MDELDQVTSDSTRLIRSKTQTYGDSWKRRGGPGAWFTTVRPWDRLEKIVADHGGDIFAAIAADTSGADGSALACVRDLTNYLILIQAHTSVLAPVTVTATEMTVAEMKARLSVRGYSVHGAMFPSRQTGYCWVAPGGSVPHTDISEWPHGSSDSAWRSAWAHWVGRVEAADGGGHHAAQLVEDAGEDSEAAPATLLAGTVR